MHLRLETKRRFLHSALSLVLFLTGALCTYAQIDRGAIVGRVVDASGAVVPRATVTVTNKATGVVANTTTNDTGEYQVLALIPGTYSVRVSSQGFDTIIRDNLELHVQDRLSIEVALRVGSVNQEVVVTGSEPLLQTESADIGNVVDSRQINDLPLNGRRYADLALLEPGVQKFYGAANPAPDRFSVNGNLELQNNFRLNGIDNNSWSENLQEFSVQVVQPPPDAVQEFRVQTRTYSSEFGNSAGAVINTAIKSGTNGYHGNLFEYVRNSIFDANSWVNKHATPDKIKPKGRFSQNQFGGTFGGPIIKDKTFFFFDMQRFTSRRATTVQSTVPTPLMKQGNFTELKNTLTNSPVAGQSGCVVGNIIQSGCIDPVGAKIAALFPNPNSGPAFGTPGSWTGLPNYLFSTVVPNDTWSLDGRVDHTLNQKDHITGSYSYYHVSRQDPPWTSDPVPGNGNFATQYRTHTQLVSLGWTHNLSNNFLSDARFGFNRDYAHSDPVWLTLSKSLAPDFGLTGIPNTPNKGGLPPIEINGLTRLGTSPWSPQYQISQAWNLTYGELYELFAPIMSRDNLVSNFTSANGGGIVTAPGNASGWANRALIQPDKNDLAPRVGVAYQFTKKMVVRGGYGVFYQHYNRIGSESLLELNPPFLQDIQLNQGTGSSTPIFQLKNGFPLSSITGTALDLTKLQLRAQDPNQRSGC